MTDNPPCNRWRCAGTIQVPAHEPVEEGDIFACDGCEDVYVAGLVDGMMRLHFSQPLSPQPRQMMGKAYKLVAPAVPATPDLDCPVCLRPWGPSLRRLQAHVRRAHDAEAGLELVGGRPVLTGSKLGPMRAAATGDHPEGSRRRGCQNYAKRKAGA